MNKLTKCSKAWLCLTAVIVVSLCCSSRVNANIPSAQVDSVQINSAREIYGQNIIYYDFSKIPVDSLILDKEISLPNDLKRLLNDKFNNPQIQDHQYFEQMFWTEANQLGFTIDKFKEMDIHQTIMAVVEVVGAKITYYDVDRDTNFIKKHGKYLPIEVYFDLGLGDCDKYRDATIVAFKIIKALNPILQNVYLSEEKLGGGPALHAWISVIIPQEDRLILSHIDPTFYDNDGALEADDFHITLENDIFMAYFYQALSGCENQIYAYQIFENEIPVINNDEQLEEILDKMSFVLLLISIHKSELGIEKIRPVIELYEIKGFTANLDNLLYRAYKIYSRADKKLEAEKYKQRLLQEFPNSFWSKSIKSIKKD